jgi:hypothetical protein
MYCSLGFNCHPAFFLKRNGLKKCSYPCDWIVSSLKNVTHFIETDFKLFLDKSQYTYLAPTKCGHKTYAENMFWHMSPLNDYEYYVRGVDRFRQLLKSSEKKTFLMMIINGEHGVHSKISRAIIQDFVHFTHTLERYTQNFTVVVVVNYPYKSKQDHIITKIGNLQVIEMDTLSASNGIQFTDENDNLYMDSVLAFSD